MVKPKTLLIKGGQHVIIAPGNYGDLRLKKMMTDLGIKKEITISLKLASTMAQLKMYYGHNDTQTYYEYSNHCRNSDTLN